MKNLLPKSTIFSYLSLLVFLLLCTVNAQAATDCAVQTEIPQDQCETLITLYTDGDNWTDNTGWKVTNMPCSWKGITCSAGNVTEVQLQENQLTGNIPDLNTLTNLTHLILWGNQLTGNIPDLSALTNLLMLSLRDNQLTGNIPDLNALTNLTKLSLGNNRLTGNIPDLSALSNLKEIWLYNNQLTGNIPDLSALTNLLMLSLRDNQLTGNIPDLSALINLQEILLNNNQLTGNIPDLSALTNLTKFSLENNSLCKYTSINYSPWDTEVNIYPDCIATPTISNAFVQFTGLQRFYGVGEIVKIQLAETVNRDKYSRVDLWVAIAVPDSIGGGMLFRTDIPLKQWDESPQPHKKSVENTETSHYIFDFEVPEGMGGEYILYAAYVEENQDPTKEGGFFYLRSNLAMEKITLENQR